MKHRSNRVKRYVRSAHTKVRHFGPQIFWHVAPAESVSQYGPDVLAFAEKLLKGITPQVSGFVEKGLDQAMKDPVLRKLVLNTQVGAHAAAVPPLFNKAEHEKRMAAEEQLRVEGYVAAGQAMAKGRIVTVYERPKKENEQ